LSDQIELKVVNFINICYKNWFFYEFMTTELFINKDVSKTVTKQIWFDASHLQLEHTALLQAMVKSIWSDN
jgi:hypothetical protein